WFDHRLRANATVWHTKQIGQQVNVLNTSQSQLIANGFPPGTPLGSAVLSGSGTHVSRNGLELQLNAAPIEGLILGASFGVHSEPPTNGLIPAEPDKNFGLNAEYDFPKFDNGMYFAIRGDATWEAGYVVGGLSQAVVSTSSPALQANLTRPDTWNLD